MKIIFVSQVNSYVYWYNIIGTESIVVDDNFFLGKITITKLLGQK